VFLFAPTNSAACHSVLSLGGLENKSVEVSKEQNSNLVLGQIDFEHPLFAPFADPRYSDFSKIHFWKHLKLDLPSSVRVLARFDNGDPALAELPVGKGRIFILAAGWQPSESQLALSSKFVPLLYSLLDLSIAREKTGASYIVGQVVPLPEGTTANVQKPGGMAIPLSHTNVFRLTDEPGIYTVSNGLTFQFAVNLDPRESKTTPIPEDELERLGLPVKESETIKSAQKEREKLQHLLATELESRQKLWRWILVAALLFLLAESALGSWITRRSLATA
jgi:hypothetical protein